MGYVHAGKKEGMAIFKRWVHRQDPQWEDEGEKEGIGNVELAMHNIVAQLRTSQGGTLSRNFSFTMTTMDIT